MRRLKKLIVISGLMVVACVLIVFGSTLYFESGQGMRCTYCHEMQFPYDQWHTSSHREIGCEECHGGAFTVDISFHGNNVKRLVEHLRGVLPERLRFGSKFVLAMTEQCTRCHRQEYASWQSGPHSATYARIFIDETHNSNNMLMDDCMRCHGMHFDGGGIGDLVTPINRSGPWSLVPAELSEMPTMPCVTCHQVHYRGEPMEKAGVDGRVPGPMQEIARPSLSLFDRRTEQYVPVTELPLPVVMEGSRRVTMSADRRQALCYQCHAPLSTIQVGSGDDRTSIGVHEGVSCLGCHTPHGQRTRASCASCHPKMSNCGLDVEDMDTTFKSDSSEHNIHWVKCADCHPERVPEKRDEEDPTITAAGVR